MSLSLALAASTSAKAMLAGMIETESAAKAKSPVDGKKGRKGDKLSRIVAYNRTGPFYRQTGQRVILGNVFPILREYFVHALLHATKGWRRYHDGPAFTPPGYFAKACPQLSKRSTWRPNHAERAAGLYPRLVPQDGSAPEGKPVMMYQYRKRNGEQRIGFKALQAAQAA